MLFFFININCSKTKKKNRNKSKIIVMCFFYVVWNKNKRCYIVPLCAVATEAVYYGCYSNDRVAKHDGLI